MKKIHSRLIAFFVALFVSLCAISSVNAQAIPKIAPLPFPTVNVQNIKLVKQAGNVFTIAFDISAGKTTEPKIIYAVDLTSMESGTLVDQNIYADDAVTLTPEKIVHKEITYTAPAYLGGSYEIKVETRNPYNLRLGEMAIGTPVTLNGTNEQILIAKEDCFLSVLGEAGDKKYMLAEGVDISQSESLVVHCPLTSTFKAEQKIMPIFQTRQYSTFGGNSQTDKQGAVTLKPGKMEWTAKLTKPTEPGVYEVSLSFASADYKLISSSLAFRYILRGESVTIQNLIADKNAYLAGETAKVSFSWSGSLDIFSGPRFGTSTLEAIVATLNIADSDKNSCAKPFTKTILAGMINGTETVSIPITRDCKNSFVSAKITNAKGKVLSQIPNETTNQTAGKSNVEIIAIIVSFIAVVSAGLIVYRGKKKTAEDIVSL